MVQTICCIGAGYVGGPSMAVMADRCPGLDITVVDLDQARIDAWNNLGRGPLPVYEPGLEAVLDRVLGRNLQFSTDVANGIRNADMVFLSVNTPTKQKGSNHKTAKCNMRQTRLIVSTTCARLVLPCLRCCFCKSKKNK